MRNSPSANAPTAPMRTSDTERLWDAIEQLLAPASVTQVLAHKLGALAAKYARRRGSRVPPPLVEEERAAGVSMLSARPLVARIRDACDPPLILLKGPEVANLYPLGGRRFIDIDILTTDADDVQRSLLRAGFVDAIADEDALEDHHHLPPLRLPALPLAVEVHSHPNWLLNTRRPALEEILEASIPCSIDVPNVSAPHPRHHAIILAVHAWRHRRPLLYLRDLVDVAAVSSLVARSDLDRQARDWGVERVWKTTSGAMDALFFGDQTTMPLRTWARHLAGVREQTVLERHVARFTCGYWEVGAAAATARLGKVLVEELSPAEGETWRQKMGRIFGALRDARAPSSRRDETAAGS
jgi:putative nucleotidyltransferase-like protein